MELQNSFEIRMKEQVDLAVKLQEELSDREKKMHDLERKIKDQERELQAMRLDNEKVRPITNYLGVALDDVVMGGFSESGFQIDRTGNEHGHPTGVFRGF
ncbi:hypothetical protein Droror1_Dr00025247 [Drosera rotundifolia]